MWVAQHILPHEPQVRGWLRSRGTNADEADDLIQDAYVRIAAIDAFEAIEHPNRYFATIVRNLLFDRIRHRRVVPIDAIGDAADLAGDRDDLDPERIAGDRRELDRVMTIVASLPARCQAIFRLRKIEGLSQREIAERLGVSENIVENDGAKGLLLIAQALRRVKGADQLLPRRLRR